MNQDKQSQSTQGAQMAPAAESLFTPPDKSLATPAWIQLRDEIVEMIRTGVLAYGQKMPTVRNLAKALDVSVSVVNQTYRYLRVTGYLETRQGSGVRVRIRTDNLDDSKFPEVGKLVDTFVQGCFDLGMDQDQIVDTVRFYLGHRAYVEQMGQMYRSDYYESLMGPELHGNLSKPEK